MLLKLLRVELQKLLSAKIVWTGMGFLGLIPLVFGLGIYFESESIEIGGENFNTGVYSHLMLGMSEELLLLYLISTILTVKVLTKESEEGSLKLLFLRVGNRSSVYLAKVLTIISSLLLIFIGFILICTLVYTFFISGTDFAAPYRANDLLEMLLYGLLVFIGVSFFTALASLLSIIFGVIQTFTLTIGITVLLKVLDMMNYFESFSPIGLINNVDIFTDANEITTDYYMALVILTFYLFIGIFIGSFVVERKDIRQ